METRRWATRAEGRRVPWKLVGGAAAAAAALGAMALFNRAATERAERDHPPSGTFIRVGGVRLHYRDQGTGAPILLLHGNGATGADFVASGLVERLARSHRVIVPDRPGYGYSERPRGRIWSPQAHAELMLALMERLGADSPVVVGHSWGALVAASAALAAPGRIKGLLLLSGYYFPTARLDVPLLSGPAIPALGDAMAYTVAPLLARAVLPALLRRIFQPMPIDARFKGEYPLALSLRPGQIRASAEETAYMIPAAAALSGRYRDIELPVVILAGDGDRIADVERQSGRLHKEIPTSALVIVPGAGHMIEYAATEAIARAAGALAQS